MKRRAFSLGIVAVAGFFLAQAPGRADPELSSQNLDSLGQWGCFTPSFKAAVHELVESKEAILIAKKEEKEFNQQAPALQQQAAEAQAKAAALRQELAGYEHSDGSDFAQLKKIMADPGATAENQRIEAQTYVWTYPASPHVTDAQRFLQQTQQKLADQAQAEKDAEAARVAARAALLQRVQAHDLSLAEWRDFLRDLSQDDLLKYLGRPQYQADTYWVYSGSWTNDPKTNQKVGLEVTFNAGRVSSVAVTPP